MINNSYIVDTALPVHQDFTVLKEKGLAYIHEYGGTEWTNFNPSDPGVTILDQLCYALTELGYCIDFPIGDILAETNDKIKTEDKFYPPGQILTTSPVTIEDYRKYIIDEISAVRNLVISPFDYGPLKVYRVYLQINKAMETASEKENICNAVFWHLSKCRNLGEIFLMPQILTWDRWLLKGEIVLESEKLLPDFINRLDAEMSDFIFQRPSPCDYTQMNAAGLSANDIFNGPLLKKGWLPQTLQDGKRDALRLIDLVNLVRSMQGVSDVCLAGFCRDELSDHTKEIQCADDQVLSIDLMASLKQTLLITVKGVSLAGDKISSVVSLHGVQLPHNMEDISYNTITVKTQPALPRAKYRDINSYYSIQNTFPEIFAVGDDAVTTNASELQIAHSRQLKGYLTLFDQILANQFSQLANVGKLLSFKNAVTGAPSATRLFYQTKDEFEKQHLEYPVPYEAFSPTYYYQSLYDIPHIKPLLKNNDSLNFSVDPDPEELREHNSWNAYKLDPYNAYMRGLMEISEDENTSISRRNDILDHLLARHGESPAIINNIIDGSVYSGDSAKDRIIFKSLYLQNLDLLSYNRMKAADLVSADKIRGLITRLPARFGHKIPSIDMNDFIFNSEAINEREKLHTKDFINYSALELKLCLLFGLKLHYCDYISAYYDPFGDQLNIRLALWMIVRRKGFILIETKLLQYHVLAESGLTGETVVPPVQTDKSNRIELIFPGFIPSFNNDAFKNRVSYFLQYSVPVGLSATCHFADSATLEKLIPAFIDWRNCLRHKKVSQESGVDLKKSANILFNMLNEMNAAVNG